MLRRTTRALAPATAAAATPAAKAPSRRTALHDVHAAAGGKMTDFAGWRLPSEYSAGMAAEHLHTRSAASLFDVSHMLQVRVHGADREAFVERVAAVPVKGQPDGTAAYGTMLDDATAGILDDLIVTRHADHVHVVLNAARAQADMAHIAAQHAAFGGDVTIEPVQDEALMALQGPRAAEALATIVPGAEALPRNGAGRFAWRGHAVNVTRCGYTGEDGFEVAIANAHAAGLAEDMLAHAAVKPAGLGARDTLRLEAGLCLYGQDLTTDVSPLEAGLLWTVSSRVKGDNSFLGAAALAARRAAPPSDLRRVGLVSQGPIARTGVKVLRAGDAKDAAAVGTVTSGAPSLSRLAADGRTLNVAMAYIPKDLAKRGTSVQLLVRNRTIPAVVEAMPFVVGSASKK